MESRLKMLRLRHGLTQLALSELSGIPQGDISFWERNGVENAAVKRVAKVARALGCSIEDLMNEE